VKEFLIYPYMDVKVASILS